MVLNFSKSNLRPMPITSQNELAHIKMLIGLDINKGVIGLSLLFDTGAALNTGYLPYHNQIIKRHPNIVAKFEHFDGNVPFEPIRLCGAITNPSEYDSEKHGVLNAVVEYFTPYKTANGVPYKLAILLGNSMTVNTILGLPTIMAGELEPRWRQKEYVSHIFQTRFPIWYMQTQRTDIPESNDEKTASVSLEVSPLDVSKSLRAAFIDTSSNQSATINDK